MFVTEGPLWMRWRKLTKGTQAWEEPCYFIKPPAHRRGGL